MKPSNAVHLDIVPVTLTDAMAWVNRTHRHHKAPQGGLFAIAVANAEIVGVAMVGRPVARMLDDGWTVEILRVAVQDGYPNACSMLYAACWRAARAMGYRQAITYTLQSEAGTSVAAAGWRCIGEAGGGTWDRRLRPRVDKHPTQTKMRWETGQQPAAAERQRPKLEAVARTD